MIVIGDLHLTRHTPAAVGEDLARLLERHAGERIALVGDFFDLSTDAPTGDRRMAIDEVFAVHPAARRAIGEHLDRGDELVLLGGNHDADLGQRDIGPALLDAIGPTPAARQRLTTSPWFWRHRGLHLEHGHLYDPDNTPGHPLVVGESSLGVHFSAEFIHPTGAHRYLQNNDETPLRLFLSAFRWYGRRAPLVIVQYFRAAFAALAKAGPFYRGEPEAAAGQEQHAHFAVEAGVPANMVDAVFSLRARSTLQSWPATFARMYLDRVFATLLVTGGLAAAATGRPKTGGALGTLGALLLTTSWVHGHNRYRGNVVAQLDAAAARIVEQTDAELVVFGHTHREHLDDRYANTGAFAFPQDRSTGRPYLAVSWASGRPRVSRRYLT
jgi:UDP-2,3-diacylglucosamine pyrophosphatase LpxH